MCGAALSYGFFDSVVIALGQRCLKSAAAAPRVQGGSTLRVAPSDMRTSRRTRTLSTVSLRCRLRVDGGVCDGSEGCPSQTRSYDREHLLALGTALQERANGSTTRQRAAVGRQRFGLLSKSGLPCGTGRSTTGGAAQELIAPVAETTGSTAQEHGAGGAGGRRAAQ